MGKRNSGNAILVVILLVVVLAIALLYLLRKSKLVENTNPVTPTYQATTGNTNSDLGTDMNTIDSSLKGSTDAQTSVGAELNATPIAQP